MPLALDLVEVHGSRRDWLAKPFTDMLGFDPGWWVGDVKQPLVFGSFVDDVMGEVARVQLNPHSTTGGAYPMWNRRRLKAIEIDLLEVRQDLRGDGMGHDVVERLLVEFPGPVVALPTDSQAAKFWRRLGWDEYRHMNAAQYHPDGPGPVPLFAFEG